ncbi:hypothetical protein BU23DRAFT_548908 [Bimuria novae-zelandiae CBS 107.79]|uniref:Uncharacterized protein n=1 Tax=Bimuria novae-zelandiae CBS 107.79 TaxID=1447943 RepID=A0A6A5VR43_9PLEO|nr:hypothetical protein BU23DRAFT_548908 [Bimuria novae-zelandiae CBS 107.79]
MSKVGKAESASADGFQRCLLRLSCLVSQCPQATLARSINAHRAGHADGGCKGNNATRPLLNLLENELIADRITIGASGSAATNLLSE